MTTIAEIKQRNRAIGHHWFDCRTFKFFNSRIESRVYSGPGGDYFVSSERLEPEHPKRYTVRHALASGEIRRIGEFLKYTNLDAAREVAKAYAKGK